MSTAGICTGTCFDVKVSSTDLFENVQGLDICVYSAKLRILFAYFWCQILSLVFLLVDSFIQYIASFDYFTFGESMHRIGEYRSVECAFICTAVGYIFCSVTGVFTTGWQDAALKFYNPIFFPSHLQT